VLEINRNSPGSDATDETFDWCHPASSDEGRWMASLPFFVGVSILAGLSGWQLWVLAGQLLGPEPAGAHVAFSIVNLVVCGVFAIGLILLYRATSENRALRRNLHLAEGLQEMQSALRKRNRELEIQSRTDFLTGVGNRLLLCETLEIETQRCDRYGDELSVALIEIGGLRRMHATLGRQAVDEAIRSRVALIQRGIRASDWLFRWADGEFLVLWLNTKPEDAVDKTRGLFERLQEMTDSGELEVPVAVGLTSYVPKEGCDRLLARADLAKQGLFRGGFRYLSPGESELSPVGV